MRDMGLVNSDEPFKRLLCQGMVVAETYYREEESGKKTYYFPADVSVQHDDKGHVVKATLNSDGQPVIVGGIEKMSKSKNNGVDPQSMVEQYGADTVRLFTMFAAPPEQSLEWSDSAVEGANRFLRRFWRLCWVHLQSADVPALDIAMLNDNQRDVRRKTHETIRRVSDACSRRYAYNIAIAAVMELCNETGKLADRTPQSLAVEREALETAILLLAPITPHISHALWQHFGHQEAVIDAPWPQLDESALVKSHIEVVIQVNGKLRAKIDTAIDSDEASVLAIAKTIDNVQGHLDGKTVRKVIWVPNKLLNIVAN